MPNRMNKGPMFSTYKEEIMFVRLFGASVFAPIIFIAVYVYLSIPSEDLTFKNYMDCFFGNKNCVYKYEVTR